MVMAPVCNNTARPQEERKTWFSEFKTNRAVMVETLARGIFPLVFLFFNLIYWPSYLSFKPHDLD